MQEVCMLPQARKNRLVVQDVGEELVVYDQERHQAHRLNRAAALVWRHCDGQTSVADLTALLAGEVQLPDDQHVANLALRQLEKAHLLEERVERADVEARVSRRDVVRKLGLTGGLTLLLPTVASIVAPTPAMAQYAVAGTCGTPLVTETTCTCQQGTCQGNCNCVFVDGHATCHCS
jgi:prepilin-type processing-associated H-X9-DG protein